MRQLAAIVESADDAILSALTAFSSPGNRDQAFAAGYNLHLAKPVVQYDLVCAIGKVLHLRGTGPERLKSA